MKYLPKILLVEDEIDHLDLISTMLRAKGFDVYSLWDGEEVLPVAKTFKPNLVIIDVKLGSFDGRELCRQLKTDPLTGDIKVILYSGLPDVENEYRDYGAEDFIAKPCPAPHLVSRILYQLDAES